MMTIRHLNDLPDALALPTNGCSSPRPLIGACDAGHRNPAAKKYRESSAELPHTHEQSPSKRESFVNASAEHSAERVRYYLSIAGQPATAASNCPPPRLPVPLPRGYLPGVV